ncbi:hypothetical protein B0J13DRAFT_648988 [Dactylonectria estremocensis]|uniref:Uncharacterized protein n=1 Tax=Dactylonectria estremocensis TaxID=1079267 RepID=A0A9P9DJ95_9HYPO|nr:hypothetical protein B0J13DRAFT_648988 [Dactylonectria estremocensis]
MEKLALAEVATPPNFAEERAYYYGMPGHPKLIARTNTHPVFFEGPTWSLVRKSVEHVGRHRLADLWNDSMLSLQADIIRALEDVTWTSIDIHRVIYWSSPRTDRLTDRPAILLISVAPNSTSWAQGHEVVMKCQTILEQHGVADVDCEMQEPKVPRSDFSATDL